MADNDGGDGGDVGGLDEEYGAIGYENSGDALPPFASDAAKVLDVEVKTGQKELEGIEYHIDENAERVKIMAEHLTNVQQEVTLTQQLVDARRKEMETEAHLKQLFTRQVGRIESEVIRLHKVIEEYKDRTNTIQTDIFKGNDRLDQFKLEMNWNQEELEQWALAARQKEEDEIALERYRRSDEAKIQELTLEIEKLTLENNQKKAAVEDEVTNTQAQQIEMDKTAEQFQQLHEDRKKLIRQWEESVVTMRARDEQLNKLGEVYSQHLQIRSQKEQRLKEKQSFLNDTQNENTKVEAVIMASDRQLMRIRLDHMNVKSGLTEFQDEVEVLKNQLGAQAGQQAAQRNKLVQLKEQVEEKKVRLVQLQRKLVQTQKNLQNEQDESKVKELNVEKADAILKDEIGSLAKAEKDLKLVKEELFKQTEELQRLRVEEKNGHSEISSAQSAIKNLSGQIAKLDAERQRQQELLYAVDFQSQLMQRRVARVSGEGPVAGNEDLHAKITSLEEQLEEQKQLETLLQSQVKRQVNDVRAAEKVVVKLVEEEKRLKSSLNELNLENESISRAVAEAVKKKEEILVHRDLVKLELNRIRANLNGKTEKVFTLENRKEQLRLSMIEREKEVEVHQEILKSKLKVTEDDRHKNAIELAERKSRIYNLKMKYESIKNKMKQDQGGQHSQAYYVLKAAQAREELQRKGDELDCDIKKSEKEVRALENTLVHLTNRNDAYKANFRSADTLSQQETEEKMMLEEQNQAANDILYKKKKQLQLIERDHAVDKKRLQEVQYQSEFLDGKIRELMSEKDVLDVGLKELQSTVAQTKEAVEAEKAGHDAEKVSRVDKRFKPQALLVSNRSFHDTFRTAIASLGGRQDLLPLYETFCREYGLVA